MSTRHKWQTLSAQRCFREGWPRVKRFKVDNTQCRRSMHRQDIIHDAENAHKHKALYECTYVQQSCKLVSFRLTVTISMRAYL